MSHNLFDCAALFGNRALTLIVESVITFTLDSVRLETAPTGGCADIFGLYYKTIVAAEVIDRMLSFGVSPV